GQGVVAGAEVDVELRQLGRLEGDVAQAQAGDEDVAAVRDGGDRTRQVGRGGRAVDGDRGTARAAGDRQRGRAVVDCELVGAVTEVDGSGRRQVQDVDRIVAAGSFDGRRHAGVGDRHAVLPLAEIGFQRGETLILDAPRGVKPADLGGI